MAVNTSWPKSFWHTPAQPSPSTVNSLLCSRHGRGRSQATYCSISTPTPNRGRLQSNNGYWATTNTGRRHDVHDKSEIPRPGTRPALRAPQIQEHTPYTEGRFILTIVLDNDQYMTYQSRLLFLACPHQQFCHRHCHPLGQDQLPNQHI